MLKLTSNRISFGSIRNKNDQPIRKRYTYSDDECLFLQKNTTAPTMIKIAGMAITIPTMAP